MKKLKQLRAANDQQLKAIHGTDYTYTETVIGYLRTDLRKDPYAIEQAINDLLTTLIDAQTAGHRVAAFFSDDPQTAADNILKELPRVPAWYLFDQYWPIVMFLFASIIFTMLVGQEHRLSLSSIAAPVAVVFAFIGVPFARGISFNKVSSKTIFGLLIAFALFIIVPLLIGYFSAKTNAFSFSRPLLISLCVGIGLVNLCLAAYFRTIALLLISWTGIWLLALLGLLLPASSLTVGLAIAGVLCATLLLFYHPEPKSVIAAN
ncbi:hypothetical protein EFP34_11700 [Lacticaseibacillus paracasei]|uniref:hypothetical protein n=1 Tax=Lacticaseibacillus paracasei TaxID=1597 RepID=UPI00115A4EF0|nr:hypothetical protein [Lacticaseibacillus paracasei]MCT3351171.1 hypothetical protein [Lacticaseibacillus paracasei]VTZ82573.1 hypothetical protein LPCP272_00507 [Lacticaseibacillus paracasei]